jgi:hypothetical protein
MRFQFASRGCPAAARQHNVRINLQNEVGKTPLYEALSYYAYSSGKLQGVWLRDLVIYILLLWNFWALSYFK